jgi:Fur family ferric uptake transcriptional regulator/Fur family zinc uptake transcriptional regulator
MSAVSVETLLRNKNIRRTRARVAVLEALRRAAGPLSAGQVTAASTLRSFDRVTVYRTLSTLKSHGLVHAVQGVDATWRYSACTPELSGCPGNHPHFLCLYCGRMFCLPGQSLPRVRVPSDATVQGKQLVVYGSCGECRRG